MIPKTEQMKNNNQNNETMNKEKQTAYKPFSPEDLDKLFEAKSEIQIVIENLKAGCIDAEDLSDNISFLSNAYCDLSGVIEAHKPKASQAQAQEHKQQESEAPQIQYRFSASQVMDLNYILFDIIQLQKEYSTTPKDRVIEVLNSIVEGVRELLKHCDDFALHEILRCLDVILYMMENMTDLPIFENIQDYYLSLCIEAIKELDEALDYDEFKAWLEL